MADRWLQRHPRRRRWLHWSPDPAGIPEPGPRPEPTPSFPDCDLSVGMDKIRRQLTIPTDLLPGLAAVLDVLRNGTPTPAAAQALRHPAIGATLGQIQAVGGLLPAAQAPPGLVPALPPGASLSATHLGHAHVMVDSERHRILIDPLLYPWSDAFERQPPTSRQLGRVDAIFFTHHHEDHLDTASLLTLPHDIPVYVPPDPAGPCRPKLTPFLKAMGFQDVRALPAGAAVEFPDGLRVEAVPFYGESRSVLGWNASCYLVSRSGRALLFHADASPDQKGR
ncbi:MAG TPA: MBL fold metallo-hydrolase, partial [Planctomycetota bacterium]|nr:MBL fold metallo-hydrolase [Planctomycetota bacterium]